jgi:hypothetical protein
MLIPVTFSHIYKLQSSDDGWMLNDDDSKLCSIQIMFHVHKYYIIESIVEKKNIGKTRRKMMLCIHNLEYIVKNIIP